VTVCNVFGHEPAIAEYVIMTMLTLTHRLFEAVTAFRGGSWIASPQFGGGPPHGEAMGRTIGIIGYGTGRGAPGPTGGAVLLAAGAVPAIAGVSDVSEQAVAGHRQQAGTAGERRPSLEEAGFELPVPPLG
jgi:hypothetical protein